MLDEGDTQMPAVEVVVEIEHMRLQAQIAAAEGRAVAEIGDAVMPERAPTLVDADPYGIDAGGRPQVVVEHEVGGGKADVATARIAALDPPLDLPEAAKQR